MPSTHLVRAVAAVIVVAFAGCTAFAQTEPRFTKSTLQGTSVVSPTSLQFGPDNRLYVANQSGSIHAYTISRTGPSSYVVTDREVINLVRQLPNHNDDGTLNTQITTRVVTGILVTGTPDHPVVYATSSDPRIEIGNDSGLDTNSGILSRLTWTGTEWMHEQLVRGLPRCEENHATNGLVLDPINNDLYIGQGGNTNMGAPSNNFAFTPEYAYSAAILKVDLDALGGEPYDLPTMDDPTRPNLPDGSDENDPFGGNDGNNMAVLELGGPVQVFSPGFRNPYDVVIHSNGGIYTIDNGANLGWGGPPVTCSNDPVESGSTSAPDALHRIGMLGDTFGKYGGHPVPVRASRTVTFHGEAAVPEGMENPIECTYLAPGAANGALYAWNSSTNGLVEYTASNFGGVMKGNLLAAGWTSNAIQRIELGPDGASVQRATSLFSNVGGKQLDVTAQGDGEYFAGTIWSCDHPQSVIYVFEPADLVVCTGADDPMLDEDLDGFSNADEIANGTDPCSNADVPQDDDGDFISNALDEDDDNDGIPDISDPFQRDAANGLTTVGSFSYGWSIGDPGFGVLGLGFGGMMSNGTDDVLELVNPDILTPGGASGKFTIDAIPAGDAEGTSNDQLYAYQLGFAIDETTGPVVVRTSVESPYFSGMVPAAGQSAGFYIGTGDQSNYLKVVVVAGSTGTGGLRVVHEVDDVVDMSTSGSYDVPVFAENAVDLFIAIDPLTGLAQPRYLLPDGEVTDLGPAVQLTGELLDAVQSPGRALATGIIATSRGGPTFGSTWDVIEVLPESTAARARVTIDPPNSHVNTSTYNANSFIIENESEPGITITRVVFDTSTAAFPDMVFDPDGAAGDVLAKGFTPNSGAAETGVATHAFGIENNGGYHELTINFTDFDPGESFGFSLDADPTSIRGAQAPGPNEAGSVSGLELAGSTITVEFSDGSLFRNRLFRTPGSLDASETTLGAPVTPAPIVSLPDEPSVPGETLHQSQTVRIEGPRNGHVRLAIYEGGLFTEGLAGGGFDIDPFESNSLVDVEEYSVDIPASGVAEVTVTLMKSNAQSGINIIQAAAVDENGQTGLTSPPMVLALTDPDLSVSSASVDFGTVPLGNTATSDITLTANSPVTINAINLTSGIPAFAVLSQPTLPLTLAPGQSATFTVRFTPEGFGANTGSVDIVHDGNNAPISVQLMGEGGSPNLGVVLYRVNAGGPEVPATDGGPAWQEDQGGLLVLPQAQNGTPSPYVNASATWTIGVLGTLPVDSTVPPTTPSLVFNTNRFDPAFTAPMQWNFPIPSGTMVEVRLYMAETYDADTQGPGFRVFNVSIEGETLTEIIDIHAKAGFSTGTTYTARRTVGADSNLDIDFSRLVQNPQINAIEVVAVGDFVDNFPPMATDDTYTIARASSVVLDILANDTDDGSIDESTLELLSQPTHGLLLMDESTGDLTYVHDGASEDPDGFTYRVADDDGVYSAPATVTINVQPSASGGLVLHRVNVGGPQLTAAGGNWSADTNASPSPFNNAPEIVDITTTPIGSIDVTSPTIPAGTPTQVFATERYDRSPAPAMSYSLPVPAGEEVILNLYHMETFVNAPGERVFDIAIDGVTVVEDLDLWAAAGGKKLAGVVVRIPVVSDGSIDITLPRGVQNPELCGIEVLTPLIDPSANTPPVAMDDFVTAAPGSTARIPLLANDTDSDGTIAPGTIQIIDAPRMGTLRMDPLTGTAFYDAPIDAGSSIDTFTYFVRDNLGAMSNIATATVRTRDDLTSEPRIRINAGGDLDQSVTPFWLRDTSASPVVYGNQAAAGSVPISTTATVDLSSPTLPAGVTQLVARTGRVDPQSGANMIWSIPGDNGTLIRFTMIFAEVSASVDPGERVFDVTVEGVKLLDNFDIAAEAGGTNIAIARSFIVQTDGDGRLNVEFGREVSNPLVNGFLVERLTAPENEQPVAMNDEVIAPRGGLIAIDAAANDTDPDGFIVPQTMLIATPPANGSASVNLTTGLIEYTHNGSMTTSDSFTYTVADDSGVRTGQATVSITVTTTGLPNVAPVAGDDGYRVRVGGNTELPVTDNDTDADGLIAPSTVTVVTPPAHGTTSVDPSTGAITYTHDGSEALTDSFTYTIADNDGGVSPEATVTLTANEAPTAEDDNAELYAGGDVDIDLIDNDTDELPIDGSTVLIETDPTNGVVFVDPITGVATYVNDTRPAGGVDTFTYSIADDFGVRSEPATVTLTILSTTDAMPPADGLVTRLETIGGSIDVGEGGVVTAWNDASAAGNSLTAVGEPIFDGDRAASPPAIVFDGVDDALQRTSGLVSLPAGSSNRTMFFVAEYVSGTAGVSYGSVDDCLSSVYSGFGLGNTMAGEPAIDTGCTMASALPGSVPVRGNGVITQTVMLDSGAATQFVNGMPVSSGVFTAATMPTDFVVGASLDRTTFSQLRVSAVLIYNRILDNGELAAVENYLARTYRNEGPAVSGEEVTIDRGTEVRVSVLDNDSDDIGGIDPTTLTITTPPMHGVASVDPSTAEIVYQHDNSPATTDSIGYTVSDVYGEPSGEAVIMVNIVNTCAADLAAPYGVLNIADVQTFLGAFNTGSPAADLAAPFGVFNIADVMTFIGAFNNGCGYGEPVPSE